MEKVCTKRTEENCDREKLGCEGCFYYRAVEAPEGNNIKEEENKI